MTAILLLIIIAALGIVFGHPAQLALERRDYTKHYND
jgi:hypothetical protein